MEAEDDVPTTRIGDRGDIAGEFRLVFRIIEVAPAFELRLQ